MMWTLWACALPEAPTPDPAGADHTVDTNATTAEETGGEDSAPTEIVAPTLSTLDPTLGDTLGGTVVTLTGTDLGADVTVTIGGLPCPPLDTPSATALRCLSPSLSAGVHDVVASRGDELSTLSGAWEAWSPDQITGTRVYNASAGVTLAGPEAEVWSFTQQAATSPWLARDGAGLVWFDERLWLLGGWQPSPVAEWGYETTNNEVWVSDDLGVTWTMVLANDSDAPKSGADARWSGRHTVGFLTHVVDGIEYLYVVGGDAFDVTSDVWRSTDGTSWELVTDDAPWGGRVLQMVGTYAGSLYLLGGQRDIYDTSTTFNDVWRSDDGGANWTSLGNAPWAPRGMTYNPVEHEGALWLIGGGTYDDAPRTFYNDVWRFDGSTWTEVSPDGTAPWLGREYHNTFTYDGRLWVSSGYGADTLNHNDLWHSTDGVTWTEVPGVPYDPGHADGITPTPYGVVHASGNALDTEVYLMEPGTGAPAEAWADQGAAGLDLSTPESAMMPVWSAEAFATAPGVVLDGESTWMQLAAWDPLPAGHSVFWVGYTETERPWTDYVNPAMTVVGDVNGSCRIQAGYSADQAELVVTDALGAWADGHVLRGSGLTGGTPHLIGFTHDVDGTVLAYIDGVQTGEAAATSYDPTWTGWNLLGAGYATGSRAEVTLGAVVVVPAVVSAEEQTKIATWARKWTDP